MNYGELSLNLLNGKKGKLSVVSNVKIDNKDDLSIAYTPGVATPCLKIKEDTKK